MMAMFKSRKIEVSIKRDSHSRWHLNYIPSSSFLVLDRKSALCRGVTFLLRFTVQTAKGIQQKEARH